LAAGAAVVVGIQPPLERALAVAAVEVELPAWNVCMPPLILVALSLTLSAPQVLLVPLEQALLVATADRVETALSVAM
jgi:hypothetical protein